jgi:hypothetical protein
MSRFLSHIRYNTAAHVVNSTYQTCCKVVLTSLIQSRYNKNVTRLRTQCCNNIVIWWLYRTCWNNLATIMIVSTRLLQVVNSLFQTCWQLGTSSANTTCWRLVGRLATRCEIFTCVVEYKGCVRSPNFPSESDSEGRVQFEVFEKLTSVCFSKLHEKPYYYLLIICMKSLHASITPAHSPTPFKH